MTRPACVLRNRSAPSPSVVPILVYADVARAIEWLCSAFGFIEHLHAAGRDGAINHAQLEVMGGAVIVGRQGGEFRPPQPGRVVAYVHVTVPDVDGHHARAVQAGARIVDPPT